MSVSFFVAGSYMESWRPEFATGVNFADGWLDPSLQKAVVSFGRTFDVSQRRPR